MVSSFGIMSLIVSKSCSTYDVSAAILSQLTKFEFDKFEREGGIQSLVSEFAAQINTQPIQFTVAGFYVITKTFLASVMINKNQLEPFSGIGLNT